MYCDGVILCRAAIVLTHPHYRVDHVTWCVVRRSSGAALLPR
jgi:hypothetical protein